MDGKKQSKKYGQTYNDTFVLLNNYEFPDR
jgi:hypothetical protein